MRKLLFLAALVAMFAVGCQKDFNEPQVSVQNEEQVAQTFIRSYDEALKIAEEAVAMVDDATTRTSKPRKIMSNSGQIVTLPVTRSGETSEEPIMYIFNNEDNAGFTVVAANRSYPSLIATTELGNYTYGESTGVEPFDLMMEDMVATLALIPDVNFAFYTVKEEEEHDEYGPLANIQWGVGSIYGSLYPDGIAYDEAAAIAQALMSYQYNVTYTITNPASNEYGQICTLDRSVLSAHFRYDHPSFMIYGCNASIHNQISRLYLEIGYRLSKNTSIPLGNKTSSFTMAKIKSVLDSFGVGTSAVTSFVGDPILPRYLGTTFKTRKEDAFIFRGTEASLNTLPNGGTAHCWLANGFDDYTYYNVTYTLNSIINPLHPNPNGYTETARELIHDYMLYFNWGCDGISNGWFHSGCFDMSGRDESNGVTVGGNTAEYTYNFSNISFFSQHDPRPTSL